MEFVKDYCSSDAHPDMAVAGFWGRLVFREFVRIAGQFDTRGRVPRKFANPVYLVKRMELAEAGVSDADARLSEGIAAAVAVGLLAPAGDDLMIPGWDRFYESHAERQKNYRDRRRAEEEALREALEFSSSGVPGDSVTSRSVTVTNSDTKTRRNETIQDETPLPLVIEANASGDAGPFGRVAEVWNRVCVPAGFAKAKATAQQKKAAATRMRESGWFDSFQAACMYMAAEPFYRGGSSSGWVATLGWLLKPGKSEQTAEKAATRRVPANGQAQAVIAGSGSWAGKSEEDTKW